MSHEQKEHDCTPRLRFPEFAGGKWYKEMLKNIALPITEKADSSCHYPALTLSCEQGLIIQEKYFGKKIAGENCNRYIKVKKNDFIYNDRTTSLSVYGTIKRNNLDVVGIVSPIYKCFCFTSGKNPIYWQYYFDARCHEAELKSIINEGARSGRFNISVKDFLKIFVVFPDEAEQQKIADCLSSLDDLITAHEQKRDALAQHKKGLMQRLFPAEGETTPRWRFPEFREAGEWETVRLGNLVSVGMCKRIFAEETNSIGGVPFYKIGTLGGIADSFISYELFDNYKNKYNYPEKGEVLITCSGTIGKIVRYSGEDAYYQDSNIVWIKNNQQGIINDFLFYFFDGFSWDKLNSTTITRIYGDDLRNILLCLPIDKKEQQKIADCLSALDERIAAQEAKIAALREHKKGLMQQLFPQ